MLICNVAFGKTFRGPRCARQELLRAMHVHDSLNLIISSLRFARGAGAARAKRFTLTRALRARRARPGPPEVPEAAKQPRAACVSTWLGERSDDGRL